MTTTARPCICGGHGLCLYCLIAAGRCTLLNRKYWRRWGLPDRCWWWQRLWHFLFRRRPGEPGFIGKVAHITIAVAQHVRHGLPMVSEAELRERRAICRACVGEGGYYDEARDVCTHPACGCVMRNKTAWAGEVCPVGKWGPGIAS